MSNTPNNPFDPNSADKGPWLYSGTNQPTPPFIPPTTPPLPASAGPPPTPPAPPKPPAPPVPTPAPSPTHAAKAADDASLASIIDTIEAIIIALIIALTFRAFIAEAFVIPTGSMAPTLLGAHFNVICPKCGYVFTREAGLDYQYTLDKANLGHITLTEHGELTSNRSIFLDPVSGKIRCPNCQYPITPLELPQYLGKKRTYDINEIPGLIYDFAWANNGDRIFVLKYLYALLEPKRFDVIVFKEPMKAQDNFIKRLIGLPGETIEIINGDIFIGPPGKLDPADREIARKPLYVQKAVWQLVYDNDYYPTDQLKARQDGSTWSNPWAGQGDTANRWRIDNPVFEYNAASPGAIQFVVREPYTYNVLGYNNDPDESAERRTALYYCGDLHLETVWTPHKSDDSIALTLGQTRNEFRASWSAKSGIELSRFNPVLRAYEPTPVTLAEQPPAIAANQSHRVVLDNVDHAVRFFIDDKLIFEHLVPWTAKDALEQFHLEQDNPPTELLKPEINIAVGGQCTLSHLKLFRDLYYTQSNLSKVDPNQTDFVGGPGTATTGNPLTLGPDEFFAMGDNSRRSHDGRSWAQVFPGLDDLGIRRGVVPRRYLLGKAIFVYWPAGFRFTSNDNIPVLSNIPLIPNVGNMRLIR